MTRNEVRRALHECLRASEGDVTLPRALADALGDLLPDVGMPRRASGKTAKIRAAMGDRWNTCAEVTEAVGFSAFHAIKQMVTREFAERREVDGVKQYRLTDRHPHDGQRVIRLPIPEGYTPEQWAAIGPRQRHRIRAYIRKGTKPRPVLTEEERRAAKAAANRRYEAKRKAARAAARAERDPRAPKPAPKPKRQKPERSLEAKLALKAPVVKKSGPRVELAVREPLPDSSAWLAANEGRVDAQGRPLVERLPLGAPPRQPAAELNARQKRQITGRAFEERKRA